MRLFALGNALIDDEFQVTDALLAAHDLAKGQMHLIDADSLASHRASLTELLAHSGNDAGRRLGGGSAANSAASYAGFGGEAHFCGRVANDAAGHWFTRDLARYGVATGRLPEARDDSTHGISGQCLVLISDDAQRTMLTHLGVSAELREQDLDERALAAADVFYLEGYLASSPVSAETSLRALQLARSSGLDTALSLSDVSMVEHFRTQLEAFVEGGITHLFCNLQEALQWADTDRLDLAAAQFGEIADYVHITLGAHGSLCVHEGVHHACDAAVANAIDTTGAGDVYAGAALFARARGGGPQHMIEFGNLAAAHIVSQFGARFPHPHAYAALCQNVDWLRHGG